MPEKQKRLNDILDSYYAELQNLSKVSLPVESEFDINKLSSILDDCFLVNIYDDKMSVSFMGDNILKAFGDDSFAKDMDKLIDVRELSVFKKFTEVVNSKKPSEDDDLFENSLGLTVKYRLKIYPLTDNTGSDKVKFIFGGMRWKNQS